MFLRKLVMTKKEFCRRVAKRNSMCGTIRNIEIVLEAIFDEIAEVMKEGGVVKIKGFGSFDTYVRKGMSINIPTRYGAFEVPSKRVPRVKFGDRVKDMVRDYDLEDECDDEENICY